MKKLIVLSMAVCFIITSTTVSFASARVQKKYLPTETTTIQKDSSESSKREARTVKEEKVVKVSKRPTKSPDANKRENIPTVLVEKATDLGIDTTGLTVKEIVAKINEVRKTQKQADRLVKITERATSLGIDTTGLTVEEIIAKIIEVQKAQDPTQPIEDVEDIVEDVVDTEEVVEDVVEDVVDAEEVVEDVVEDVVDTEEVVEDVVDTQEVVDVVDTEI